MRGDDRLMTILTGIVLTVALGAVAQRGDVFEEFRSRSSIAPRDDVALLPAGGRWRLDVVANDEGAQAEDGGRLLITEAPACGAAWRMEGALVYEAGPACAGLQRIVYCLADGDDCPEAVVSLTLRADATGPESVTGTPVAALAGAEGPTTAAVGAARNSGFTVEAARPARPGGPLAAISAFGSLAPEAEAAGDEAPTPPAD